MASGNNKKKFIIIGIVVAVLVLVALFIWPFSVAGKPWKTSSWYAIHLTNGVVYVGDLKSVSSQTIVMDKVYYMQSYGAANNNEGKPAQFYGLVMQGTEAPLLSDQTMFINRSNVLFWEKLQKDSDMVNKLNGQNK